jgi:hypothetical protein
VEESHGLDRWIVTAAFGQCFARWTGRGIEEEGGLPFGLFGTEEVWIGGGKRFYRAMLLALRSLILVCLLSVWFKQTHFASAKNVFFLYHVARRAVIC